MTRDAVVIVDYGMGNVRSLANMLARVGVPSQISDDPNRILTSHRLLLPGVGAFDHAMRALNDSGIGRAIQDRSTDPDRMLVGVCLGMQLLMDESEEGRLRGLGLIPGEVRRFPPCHGSEKLPVPHMGWNQVTPLRESRVASSLGAANRYYFVHSYFAKPRDPVHTLGVTTYGIEFASVIERGSVIGLQFHPEKSHRYGWQLLSELFGQDRHG